jgi:hypothetical protein
MKCISRPSDLEIKAVLSRRDGVTDPRWVDHTFHLSFRSNSKDSIQPLHRAGGIERALDHVAIGEDPAWRLNGWIRVKGMLKAQEQHPGEG